MKQTILATWNAGRIIRLLLGIMALVQGIRTMDKILLFAGGFLLVASMANIGCGASGCTVPQNKAYSTKN